MGDPGEALLGENVIVAVLERGEVAGPEAGAGAGAHQEGAHREGEADPAGVHPEKQQNQDRLATASRLLREGRRKPRGEAAR